MDSFGKLCFNRGLQCLNNRAWDQAISNFTSAVQSYEGLLNTMGVIGNRAGSIAVLGQLGFCHCNIGLAYFNCGNDAVAVEHYLKAIAYLENHPGSTELAHCYANIGLSYRNQDKYYAAVESHQKAIAIYERNSPGSIELAQCYRNIGNVYDVQGDFAAAIENHQKAISIQEHLCPGSPDLADSYYNNGNACCKLGDHSAAIDNHLKAIAIRERQCPGSTDLALAYTMIAVSYSSQNNHNAAIQNLRKSIVIRERHGPGSINLAHNYNGLGYAYYSQGDSCAAIENYKKAIAIFSLVSPGSTDLVICYNNLALAFENEGDYSAVVENYKAAISIRKIQCPGSMELADSYSYIGCAYFQKCDYSSAFENFQQAQAIYERCCPGSTNEANTYHNIGAAYTYQGDYSAAIEMYQKSIAMHEKNSPTSKELINAYLDLGHLHFTLGGNLDAITCFNKPLAIASFGTEDYMKVLRAKVSLLVVIGDLSTTQRLLIEAYAFSRSDEHKNTKVNGFVLVAQSEALAEVNDWEEAGRKAAAASAFFQGNDSDSKLERARIGSLQGMVLLQRGLIDESRNELKQASKIFEELNLQNYHEYFCLLVRLGELELRCNNLSEAESFFRKSHKYFMERSSNSWFFAENLSGQAQLLFLRKDWDGAITLLKQAIQICEKNGYKCRTYRIINERLEQVHKELRKLEPQNLNENKPKEELVKAQAEPNPQEKYTKTGLEPNRFDDGKAALRNREKEAMILVGRRLLKEALESDDGSANLCNSLPVEYLEFTSNSWTNKIGSGGFGAVYKGHDTLANFTFAIKTISPDRLEDEEKVKFKEEIQLLSSLYHPNIIRVLGFCETPQRLCMVLEFAAGGSVHKILSADRMKTRLSPSSRLYVVEALVSALEYLHSKNIFHRDVKPENICLWQGWEVNPKMVLIDFGIASRVAATGAVRTMTSNPGTTLYMAEEYLHHPFKFTAKSEVFSIGVVMVCLLTGDCSFSSFNHRACTFDVLMRYIDISAGTWVSGSDKELATMAVEALQTEEFRRPTILDLRKRMKQLRARICSDEHLPAALKARITSFTTRSRPSRVSSAVGVGGQVCIRCGLTREEGVVCQQKHFICSEGTCLEELVREQIGNLKFRCCGNRCSKSFEIIDLYGKVSSLLYADVLMAMDRMTDRGVVLEAIQNCITEQLQKHILPAVVQAVSCASVSENRASLQTITSNIELLKKMASDNDLANKKLEKEMNRLLVKQERGAAGISEQQENLLRKMDELKNAHLDGVAKLASGRLQCPRLFFLMPVRSQRGRFCQASCIASEYQLYFLCAHDHSAVKTSVLIKQPKKWIKKALPIVKFAFLTIRLLVASYGIAIPAVADFIPGVASAETKMNTIIEHLTNFLDSDTLAHVEEWVDEASQGTNDSLSEYMEMRAKEISEEAYAALATEAYKPENRGWMQEMEISQKGSVFAWVKKENVAHWTRG